MDMNTQSKMLTKYLDELVIFQHRILNQGDHLRNVTNIRRHTTTNIYTYLYSLNPSLLYAA